MKTFSFFVILALLFIGTGTASPQIIAHAEVEGKSIDIAKAKAGENVFPQNRTFNFKSPLPQYLTGAQYTRSLIENEGALRMRSPQQGTIYIAYASDRIGDNSWEYTGDSFAISSARNYYIFKKEYTSPNQWVEIPRKPKKNAAPTLLFAKHILWSNHPQVPGTVIAQVEVLRQTHLTNPTVVVLPDGDYLAAISGAFHKGKAKRATSFFLSSDKGKTWTVQSKNSLEINYGNLFVHNGQLYIMGTRAPRREVIISRSADKGKTWTQAQDDDSGLLLEGKFHTAPVPVVIAQGRIWRAMETNDGKKDDKRAFVMSAPADADLLKSSSWTATKPMKHKKEWLADKGLSFSKWIEGNVVVDPDGNVVNIMRVDEEKEGKTAAIIHVVNPKKLTFDPMKDIIEMPGGGKKFTIRYDSTSKKYWTLVNPVFDEDKTRTHSGIYKNGLYCGIIRNHLALIYSDDLRHWTIKDVLISSDNPFFHGFQYVDWQFDGNDIIAVSRTAFDEERGLPTRQHDANYFTFHRFSDFRNSKIPTIFIKD